MTVSAKRLNESRKELADALTAFENQDSSSLSQEGLSLIEELVALEDTEWDSLLESLEDSELRDLLGSARHRLSEVRRWLSAGALSHIQQIGHKVLFDISQRSLEVRLHFNKADGQSLLDSSQDLEDTLWIGATIVEVVSEAMQAMDSALNPEAQRDCIGTVFEQCLNDAENAVREIRRIFTATQEADTPEQPG